MTFKTQLASFLLVASLITTGWLPSTNPKPLKADWCQCVIFVLNLLGIEQIPGEYWTAASLAVPDNAGKTWMDYQGYTKRTIDQIPQTGDLLVLDSGAEVITVQTWDGTEHLVPVPVDIWAGHIGIILDAMTIEKEGTSYLQINLLSANWGVSSSSLGVVGSCFNVDQSTFLLPEGYKKASFFYATDPIKMRERMVNRAKRWAMLGLAANAQASLDGFPITPSGFISQVLAPVGKQPVTPVVTDILVALVEIPAENALPGDLVVFGGEKNPGLGVIVSGIDHETGVQSLEYEVISMIHGKKVNGPEKWQIQLNGNEWAKVLPDASQVKVLFFRYKDLPGYPFLSGRIQASSGKSNSDKEIDFGLSNGGGSEINISNLEINAYPISENGNQQSRPTDNVPVKMDLTLKPGEADMNQTSLQFPKAGNYKLEIQFEWKNATIRFMDTELVTIE